ncbi:Tetratricopeptide repeat-containing protein [Cyclobacterium lianum]|uniref:Tetratricopeptide repeat-containing protein n=1 Tax=Cyclobacterium lianum TaxID=388280 RepID=A0A1M7KZX7_9BACT|nr:tetratricopeptide repeat protein [Cyclobacterium lianum]SHM71129.1 Tetratricopeptide repeat-containing protein [Cyclobacterium lianum]
MDKEKAIELNNKGARYFLNEAFDNALECYQQALDLDPTNSSVLNNLGLFHQQQKSYKTALEFFDKAIAVDSKPTYLVNSGNALAMMGIYPQARQRYLQALQQDRQHQSARVSLAQLATHTGDYDEAVAMWKKLVAANNDASYMIQLAKVYMKIKDWEKALQQLHSIPAAAGDKLAWFLIGKCEFQLKNHGLAGKAFKMALAEDPDHIEIRQHLAINYLAMGEWEEGIRHLSTILRLEPQNYQVMTELAVVYLGRGDRKKAADWLKNALQLNPDFSKALHYKSILEQSQGGE